MSIVTTSMSAWKTIVLKVMTVLEMIPDMSMPVPHHMYFAFFGVTFIGYTPNTRTFTPGPSTTPKAFADTSFPTPFWFCLKHRLCTTARPSSIRDTVLYIVFF